MTRSDFRVRAAIGTWRTVQRYPRLAAALRRPARSAWQLIAPSDVQVMPGSAADWPFVVRDRRRNAGVVLVIDDKIPEFDRHAGGLFVFQLLDILLDAGIKVLYLPDDRYPRQPYTRLLQQRGVEVLHGHFNLEHWLQLNAAYLDAVLIARPHVASKYIREMRRFSRARLVYYTHDLHFLRERRRYESTGDAEALRESERLKAIETWIARSVDVVATPSVDELPEIERLRPRARAVAIPPFAEATASTRGTPSPLGERHAVIFVAGFSHVPNVHAAETLVNEIMPIVWERHREAAVFLVGSNPPERVGALAKDGVTVTSFVPDLQPYYDRARVSVNPLFFGAGVKGKILSSLEAGVPVVTTLIGNEGIGLTDGVNVLLGATPVELADQVLRVFDDPTLATSLADAGGRFLEERFSRQQTQSALFDALELAPPGV